MIEKKDRLRILCNTLINSGRSTKYIIKELHESGAAGVKECLYISSILSESVGRIKMDRYKISEVLVQFNLREKVLKPPSAATKRNDERRKSTRRAQKECSKLTCASEIKTSDETIAYNNSYLQMFRLVRYSQQRLH